MLTTPAGELKERVTLQRRTMASDLGQDQPTWSDIGIYWAKVTPKSGTEQPSEDGTRPLVTYEVTMRNIGAIVVTDQLLWKTKTLSIASVLDHEGIEYTITAVEEL